MILMLHTARLLGARDNWHGLIYLALLIRHWLSTIILISINGTAIFLPTLIGISLIRMLRCCRSGAPITRLRCSEKNKNLSRMGIMKRQISKRWQESATVLIIIIIASIPSVCEASLAIAHNSHGDFYSKSETCETPPKRFRKGIGDGWRRILSVIFDSGFQFFRVLFKV